MHRVSQLLLAVGAAGGLALGVRALGADANPEAQLLQRFQRDNRARAEQLNERLTEALKRPPSCTRPTRPRPCSCCAACTN